MSKTALATTVKSKSSRKIETRLGSNRRRRRTASSTENSDVLISAVISSYLLTHLHQVLQRAEYGASKEGKTAKAANFAQLRKVLCMDARSMEDASANGVRDAGAEKIDSSIIEAKVA